MHCQVVLVNKLHFLLNKNCKILFNLLNKYILKRCLKMKFMYEKMKLIFDI